MNVLRSGIRLAKSPLATNTLSQLIVKISTSLSGLLVIFLISYYLGFFTFGSFSKVVAFVSFFYLIVDFGINSVFLRDNFVKSDEKLHYLVFFRLALSLLLFLTMVLISQLLPYNPETNSGFSNLEKLGIVIFGFTLFTQGTLLSLTAHFQKNLSYSKILGPSIASTVVLIVGIFYAIEIKSVLFVFASYVFSQAVTVVLLTISIKNRVILHINTKAFINFSKTILVSAAPIGLMLFFNLAYAKADIFILSLMKPTSEVGIYGFSYRFFEFAIAIPTFFANSAFPILIAAEKNHKDFISKTKKYTLSMIILSLVVMFMMIIFSPLLGVLKGEFRSAVLPVQILSLALPFFFTTSILQWVLVLKRKIKFLLLVYFFSMLLNVILNIIFIPHFSYMASSVITVICEALVALFFILYLLLRRMKNYRI